MPILGVIASGISGHLTPAYDPSAYDALASVTLSASASSITLAGIPSGYKHLQIRGISRDTNANSQINSLYMYFNGDNAGSSYSWHRIEALGSGTPTSSGYGSQGTIWIGPNATNGYTSGMFAAHIIDILDYASTNKYKTVRHLGGFDANGTGTEPGEIAFTSGSWRSLSAINSITIYISGYSQVAGTSFALYGVK